MKVRITIIVMLSVAVITTALGKQPLVQVYPSGDSVPENLLRIELRFSAPLWPALRIDQVKLVDLKGVEVKDAFFDLPLPTSDGKKALILLHPGRVKTGVGANIALGRALHDGDSVTLVVNHPALANPFRKHWHVTAFDGESPQPARWTFEPPQSGTRSPLVLHLTKPISSSSEDLIAIRDPNGRQLAGDTCLKYGETEWLFVPTRRWHPGNYAVVVHPDLEDCAGNRSCAPYEANGASRLNDREEAVLPFEISK
jgi:hypothetical protein